MNLLAIVGPTASGKTNISLAVAQKLNAEIVCVDSMLVYREFNVGTAKPTLPQRTLVPHHVIDVIHAEDTFSAFDFCQQATKAIQDIQSRGKIPLLVGGTGFYLKALETGMVKVPDVPKQIRAELEAQVQDEKEREALYAEFQTIDPELSQKVPIQNTYRLIRAMEVYRASGIPFSKFLNQAPQTPKFKIQKIGLEVSKEHLLKNIEQRTSNMISEGLLDEVSELVKKYPSHLKPMKSVGYKEAILHLQGKMPLVEMKERIGFSTWQLAKRQLTWFRRDAQIQWIGGQDAALVDKIQAFC
ncbi:MAG: tRNA (adenosine(37)-N6)-dimethylallyltransferase MiaA [Deltaproteobacteria bacterium RIFCSPHIGHO2_02_FULL_40_11]|nr:MAG: tRNA (adenosine(37)-N6)-dimethylallyltransferase MiaA [Deltaproteobacteria bacterium RIFCSPHIGHO2_02_FULL_40_11]